MRLNLLAPPAPLFQNRYILTTHISDFEKITNPNILENKINFFTEAFRSTYEHASRPITNKNHTYTPQHIQNLIRQKNQARKTFQNTLNPIHKTNYNRLQKIIKKELKKFSDQTWKIKLEAMNTQDNTLWQYQKYFRKKRSDIPSLNNTAITDEQKAELLAETFQGQKGGEENRRLRQLRSPPNNLSGKLALPARPIHPRQPPFRACYRRRTFGSNGRRGDGTSIEPSQIQEEVPVVAKKPRISPFFVSPKGDWRQLVALAKLIAPSFQSQMSGRFLKKKVTVADDVDYRALSQWLERSGVEFKSFVLKQDRPVKVVLRGLPFDAEPEDIKTEIEAEGFKVLKISQMKNYRTKAPMPLFYLQIQNGADAA
ncbi:zinc finger protein [Trichonephila clavipes]|nr:zinc finger protein [Trichonephila clavipes]